MGFYTPQAEDPPTYQGQAVLDACDITALLNGMNGTGVASGGATTATGSSMVLTVASVIAAINGSVVTNTGGTVTPANGGTYDRRDAITLTSAGALAVVQGAYCTTANWTTASAGNPPIKPAIPSTSVLLYEVYVPASATTLSSGNLVDKRVPTSVNESLARNTSSLNATASPNELTILTGSTGSKTLTLPTTPPAATLNSIMNNATVSVTLAPGGSDSLVILGGSSANIVMPPNSFYQVVYVPSTTTWYVLTGSQQREQARVSTVTQSATPAINSDNMDIASITGLAQAITGFTMSGSPQNGDKLIIQITDNATARAITWGSSFESSGNVTLPTTTVISTMLSVGFIYNGATSKWRCVAVA